jgi:hypothetical protein
MRCSRWLLVVATFGPLAVAPPAGATVAFQRADLPAGGNAPSVAVGDLDGRDGPDIVAALYDVGALSVRLNHGDGTFADPVLVPAACGPVQVELGDVTTNGSDYERDGRLDAVVACLNTGHVVRMAGDGAGGFAAATQPGPPSNGAPLAGSDFFVLARMREDDGPPLILIRETAGTPQMLCASYDWASADPCMVPPNYPGIGGPLVAGDVNGSGRDEVVTLGGAEGVAVFGIAEIPGAIFTWSTRDFGTTSSGAKTLAVGDLEPDGHPDVVTGWGDSSGGSVGVLHGTAEGLPDLPAQRFQSVTALQEVAIDDFDGDGRNDVLAATGAGRAVVHSGNGAGGLGGPQDVPLLGYQNPATATVVHLAVADLDGNGSRDAVVLDQSNQTVEVLRNQVAAYAPPAGGGGGGAGAGGPGGGGGGSGATAGPAPIVPPLPAPKVMPSPFSGIKGVPASAIADTKFNVSLGSATNPPTASVTLTLTVAGAKAAAKRKPKPVTIGTARVKIPTGGKRALKVGLNATGRSLLRHRRRLSVTVTLVATAKDARHETRTRKLTLTQHRRR